MSVSFLIEFDRIVVNFTTLNLLFALPSCKSVRENLVVSSVPITNLHIIFN